MAAVLLVALVLRTADVLLVVFLSVVLAVYLRALAAGLVTRLGMPPGLALLAAVVISLGLLTGIVIVVVPPVVEQVRELAANLPGYLTTLSQNLNDLLRRTPFLERSVGTIDLPGLVASSLTDVVGLARVAVVPYLKSSLEIIIEGISVLVMGAYLALHPKVYRDGFVALVPPARRPLAERILDDLGVTLRAWVAGQIVAMTLLGLLTTLGLWLLGIPFALAFGTFAGVAAIVPFFGTLFSTVLPALFALTVGGLPKALAVAGLGVAVHLIEANFVSPVVMERQVNLPPVLTIAGVLVMGELLGTIGLLVAVPVLAVVLVLVRHLLLGEVYGDQLTPLHPVVLNRSSSPGAAAPLARDAPAPPAAQASER
ncbi:MAG TPA: AI-2E family transporter [Gemmatimonadales bacterium]|nr:AI-2E family transporter [Gemmatimonadales bacterium]